MKITLEELYKLQYKLDCYIVSKSKGSSRHVNLGGNAKMFLNDRITALFCEVGEFANANRGFKYWSRKPPESRMRLLDEYADILHFYLSIGNTMGFTPDEVEEAYLSKNAINYKRQEENY